MERRSHGEMELWDAYDAELNRIEGMTLVRGRDHEIPEGVYHLVCFVLVRHADGDYLLMLRDPRKPGGGRWEATAGGSALRGESPEDCARRELFEETGIRAGRLTELARAVSRTGPAVQVDFFCETDCGKRDVVPQEGETAGYRWASREELLGLGDNLLIRESARRLVENAGREDPV